MGRYEDELEAAKRASTLELLFKCARLANEAALARVPGGAVVRPAHTTLFPHIDLHGTRLTELARRVGISKQAVGQLVDDLEALGMVRREPDPDDGRAKRVVWTERGRQGLLEGLATLQAFEKELAAACGVRRWAGLRGGLIALHDHLTSR
jgi:DNA-binding MarR family transcriptional regulator